MKNSTDNSLPKVFTAPVLHGKKLGRKLGAPTLNQAIPSELSKVPFGVYFSRCTVSGKTYFAVTNVGTAPTVTSDGQPTAESHLFGLSDFIYGEEVITELLHFHRPEKKFDDVDELSRVIADDVSSAMKFFGIEGS